MDSICNIGANKISIKGNIQLSWIICIICVWNIHPCFIDDHSIHINNYESECKAAKWRLAWCLILGETVYWKFCCFVQKIFWCWINWQNRCIQFINIGFFNIHHHQQISVSLEVNDHIWSIMLKQIIGIEIGSRASTKYYCWIVCISVSSNWCDIGINLSDYIILTNP